jgi:hypothetical protein
MALRVELAKLIVKIPRITVNKAMMIVESAIMSSLLQ